MTMPEGRCPRCSQQLTDMEMPAETIVVDKDGIIRASKRQFYGKCSEHGRVPASYLMGNHSTIAEKEINTRYPKKVMLRMKDRMGALMRSKFNLARRGKFQPDQGDIRSWDRHAWELPHDEAIGWPGVFSVDMNCKPEE